MKYLIKSDKKKRKLFNKFENNKIIFKSISKNFSLKNSTRLNSIMVLSKIPCSKVKIVDRCVISGRKSKISKKYKFSRLKLLKFSRLGYILGIRKSKW